MSKANPYFPCELIDQGDDYSIVCSNFHYFDDHFGDRGAGGYTIERLAKTLVREHAIKGVKFDSEAGMFCAISEHKGPLKQLCTKLRTITGGEKKHVSSTDNTKPSIPLDQAEKLLLKGFVVSLDKRAQSKFLRHVPCPALSKRQAECIQSLRKGTDAEKMKGAKKVCYEAAAQTRDWGNYLSHPWTTETLLDCCDENRDSPAVYDLLIRVLVLISMRHLPDLRTQPYFLAALEAKRKYLRWNGLKGLYQLKVLTPELAEPLLEDKASQVRAVAESCLRGIECGNMANYPSWMFDRKHVTKRPSTGA